MPNPDPGVLFIIFICVILYLALVSVSALATNWRDSVDDAELPFSSSRAMTQSPRQIVDRAKAAKRNRFFFFALIFLIGWLVIRDSYPLEAFEIERVALRLSLIFIELVVDFLVALLRFLSTAITRNL